MSWQITPDIVARNSLIHIAEIAHEVNRAYCKSIGDDSQVPWKDTPDWQKGSAWQGVLAILQNPETGPGESHAGWLKEKVADGWVWGPVKDPELKQHPCMVPFEDLPAPQQIKDYLFVGTVKAMLGTMGL